MIVPEYLKNPLHPITVNLIGVGGTGSLVLPRLARMDYGLKLLGHPGLMVFSYDDDIVEQFNIGRQNFTDTDLRRNKAVCITEKCNLGYGLLWKAYRRKFEPRLSNMANITIICVDNFKFRKSFYDFIEKNRNKKNKKRFEPYEQPYFIIDGGNGKDFGQVVVSQWLKRPSLKNPIELFPDMELQDNEETQGIAGCSYEESLARQDFFINDEIAVGIMKILWKIFREPELKINAIMINQEKCKQLPILAQQNIAE